MDLVKIWWKRNGNQVIAWNKIQRAEPQCFNPKNKRLFKLKTRKLASASHLASLVNEIHSSAARVLRFTKVWIWLHDMYQRDHIKTKSKWERGKIRLIAGYMTCKLPKVKSTEFVQRKKKVELNRRNYSTSLFGLNVCCLSM